MQASTPYFFKINFDGNVHNQSNIDGFGFNICNTIGIFIAIGGVQILIYATTPMAELCAACKCLTYAIYKLQALPIWMENNFMTVVRWLFNPLLDDNRWHSLLQDCWCWDLL